MEGEENHYTYKTTLPPNTMDTLYVPAKRISQITEAGKPIGLQPGFRQANDEVVITMESGSYSFTIRNE